MKTCIKIVTVCVSVIVISGCSSSSSQSSAWQSGLQPVPPKAAGALSRTLLNRAQMAGRDWAKPDALQVKVSDVSSDENSNN